MIFSFKAKDGAGEIVEDTIQATNREDAVSSIRSKGLQVLTVKSSGGGGARLFGGSISVSEKAQFCRFMATMLRSGMSLPEAVEIIREGTNNKRMAKILGDISYQTQKGKSLSVVISQYEHDFDPIFLTMVKVGEESGTLEKSFDYLATQLSASHELNQKVKGSMMYPAVIIAAMFGNGLMMMLFVLPRIAGAFLKMDIPLPLYTQIVLKTGLFFGNNIPLVLGALGVSIVILIMTFMIRSTRQAIMGVVARLPVVNKISQHLDIARFARTLATLLKSGVPIIESLDVAANTLGQKKFRDRAKTFSAEVAKGESLSNVIVANKALFPIIVVQTIKAGEQSGSLEIVLQELADFYEKEVDFSLKKFTAVLEPVLMLLIGVVVGLMVVIMIAPIYSIIGGLQSTISK